MEGYNKEEYVSFDTAKMLKILGFKWETEYCYCGEYEYNVEFNTTISVYEEAYDGNVYPCPTQAVAMRWLREVENYHIYVMLSDEDIPSYNVAWDHFFGTMIKTTNIVGTFPTYEEAAEAGIKEVLNKLMKENNDA